MALIQDTPTSLPRSNAKRAWGLLQDVKQAILAEPRRIDMRFDAVTRSIEEGGPACGTVGCFAGWTQILIGRGMDAEGRVSPYFNFIGGAQRMLGACNYRVRDNNKPGTSYFNYFGENHVFNNGRGDACGTTTPGTLAHAKAVVRRINRFMRKNERILRNKKV